MYRHEYSLELDVIGDAGDEAVKKLAENGNKVYVDLDELITKSEDEKDKKSYAFKEALRFLTNGEFNGKEVKLKNGGVVSWESPDGDNIVHITRSPGKKMKLLSQNKKVSFPDFLQYGPELLSQGIIDIRDKVGDNINIDPMNFKTYEDFCDAMEIPIRANQYVFFPGEMGENIYHINSAIEEIEPGRFMRDEEYYLQWLNLSDLRLPRIPDFKLRNLEQKLGFRNFQDPNIEINICTGGSGSGKSVVTYISAIQDITGNKEKKTKGFSKESIILFKSNDIIGGKERDLGLLPGDIDEKTYLYMKSYMDAHRLCGFENFIPFKDMLSKGAESHNLESLGLYLPKHIAPIEIEHLQYARGRTFENKVIIVEEAQNYSPFEIKQLLERVGIGSKVYLVGDPFQVDNPRLSPDFNGLTFAASALVENHPRFAMIQFDQNYRSQTADIMRGVKAPRD